jgi:thiamine transport system substrate-binding protein
MSRQLVSRTVLLTLTLALVAACAGTSASPGAAASADPSLTVAPPATFPPGTTVTLLAHDSFVVSKEVLAAFEKRTGLTVKVVTSGDAGIVVNKAVLSAGNPEGDVLFGLDNTLLSRAVDAGTFEPYRPAALSTVVPALTALVPGNEVTPVDYGDVCVNLDDTWFAAHHLAEPRTLADLTLPAYKSLLVVENPATSSPGLAFLLATVARYGASGWAGYWTQLRANGVQVENGWTEAYEGAFTGGGKDGKRPIVVSYGTSPPAEIVYASDPKPAKPSTSVMTDGCFRQVEFVGVLMGAKNPLAAKAVVDWMLSPAFQQDEPLSMFVYPSVVGTTLPPVFTRWAVRASAPLTVPPDQITANRERWVDQWTSTVLH